MVEPPRYVPPSGDGRPHFDPTDPLISADYAGWWRRTLAVITHVWPQLLVLQAAGAVVTFLCGVAVGRVREPFMVESDQVQGVGVAARISAQITAALVDVTVFTVVTLAVVYLVVLSAAGRQPTLGECLRGAARRLLPLIGWSLLAGVLVGVGLLLCLLPGIYFIVVLILLAPVVAIERRQGIGRCFDLFHTARRTALGRNGTILAIMLAVATLGWGLQMAITAAVGSNQGDPGAGSTVRALAADSLTTAVVGILTGPLAVTAYASLRTKREPISTADLALQLNG